MDSTLLSPQIVRNTQHTVYTLRISTSFLNLNSLSLAATVCYYSIVDKTESMNKFASSPKRERENHVYIYIYFSGKVNRYIKFAFALKFIYTM